jgi:predicted RNase H-like HicB family nuclease
MVIKKTDDGKYLAYVPGIEGCEATGKTESEAKAGLMDVFAMMAEIYEEEGEPFWQLTHAGRRWSALVSGQK